MSKRTRSNKNLKFIIGGALLLLLVLALIVQAAVSTGAYYMTVGEVQSSAPSLLGERIRVNDAVVANSEEWNAQEIILKFSITDEGVTDQVIDSGTSLAELPVIFYGPRPDNFQRAVSAIVEGELQPDGSFKADTLLLKCPSRYEKEPEEVFNQATR